VLCIAIPNAREDESFAVRAVPLEKHLNVDPRQDGDDGR
jgi:hypothetical protein